MNTRRRLSTAGPAVVVAALLAGCGSAAPEPAAPPGDGSSSQSAAPESVLVVASTDVYGSIVSAVGGDAVEVTSIIDDPAANPHEYEATPADAAELTDAQLVVFNGADFDPFVEPLIESAGTSATPINVAELSGLEAQVPAGEEFNEHVWYSLPTVQLLADTVAAELGKADPASASTFTANAEAFKAEVDGLIADVEAINTAHAGKLVAITEPLPVYLVEAAGLENVTPEEFAEAVEEGNDAPAAVVSETLDLFSGPEPVSAVLADVQNENAATQQVQQAATAAGVPIVPVTETLPEGTTEYVAWMGQQIDALAAALDATP